jgi:hypothetical protein
MPYKVDCDHTPAWVRLINFTINFFDDQYEPETILAGARNHCNSHLNNGKEHFETQSETLRQAKIPDL